MPGETFWQKNGTWIQWIVGILMTLFAGSGIGSLVAKGLTAEAEEKVRTEYEAKIEALEKEKGGYIKILEDEVDKLQLDAVSVGFKYDLCCSTGGQCQ